MRVEANGKAEKRTSRPVAEPTSRRANDSRSQSAKGSARAQRSNRHRQRRSGGSIGQPASRMQLMRYLCSLCSVYSIDRNHTSHSLTHRVYCSVYTAKRGPLVLSLLPLVVLRLLRLLLRSRCTLLLRPACSTSMNSNPASPTVCACSIAHCPCAPRQTLAPRAYCTSAASWQNAQGRGACGS